MESTHEPDQTDKPEEEKKVEKNITDVLISVITFSSTWYVFGQATNQEF